MVTVRALVPSDAPASSAIHLDVLDMEFLARCGPGFLRAYHRAWMDSPAGLALAAVDEDGTLAGVLLGALDPAVHFKAMVRRHGPGLAGWLLIGAATRPSLAWELLTTRLLRYLRGVARMARGALPRRRRPTGPSPAPPSPPGADRALGTDPARAVGEVTHVMVRPDSQGSGAGRALLEAAREAGARAGLDELVLVTPPDMTAGDFYEHLGWRQDGSLTSRSGESFVRYRLPL